MEETFRKLKMDNSKKNKNGQNTQQWVEAYLKAENITYKKNVYAPENIFMTKKVHFEITHPNGRVIYVNAVGDLFDGGSQIANLELVYQSNWSKGDMFYICQRANIPEKFDDRKRKAWESIEGRVAGDIEAFRRVYNGLMPKD